MQHVGAPSTEPRGERCARRGLELSKAPGIAETLDWVEALASLGQEQLEPDAAEATLGSVLKYHEDIDRARDHGLGDLVAGAKRASER